MIKIKELDTGKVALITGLFISGWHVVWSALILTGFVQPLLDFIFWAHMLTTPIQVTGFSITQAITLVIVTFIVGFVGGWIFSWLWNKLHE